MKPIPIYTLANVLGLKHPSTDLVCSAAIDSREVSAGDLFFAIKGDRVDGHDYLCEVANRHAAAAIVDTSYRGDPGIPLLRVPDVSAALHTLARYVLKKMDAKVVGITGSAGKTTTKEFAKCLLKDSFNLFASPKSYNSQLTLPLSILMTKGDEKLLLLEMGMSERGQIAKLVETAPPDIALLTTVLLQHVDHFPEGLIGIAKEKAAIFSHEKTKLGLLPYGMAHFDEVASVGKCVKKTFSSEYIEADFFFEMKEANLPLKIYDHNLAAAVSLALSLDVPIELIYKRALALQLPPMRFEKIERSKVTFINDSYNANPVAMKAALSALPEPKKGKKRIAVLGAMNALGHTASKEHRDVALAALSLVDHVLCIGEHWQEENKSMEHFTDRQALEMRLVELVRPGDVILLKGSRVFALDQILNIFP